MTKTKFCAVFLALGWLIFLPGLVLAAEPQQAIVQIKVFTEDENYNLSELQSGSGVIIDASGIVLTNAHVLATPDPTNGGAYSPSAIQVCKTENQQEKPDCSYTATLIAVDGEKDVALIKMTHVSGSAAVLSSLPISALNTFTTGETIKLMGYPEIGGENITTSQGIISGQETKYGMLWIKTDATMSFGSSGGAAVNQAGELIGITTAGHSDTIGSFGYILSVASLRDWINSNKSLPAKAPELIDDNLKIFVKKQLEAKTGQTFTFEKSAVIVSKTADTYFFYEKENAIGLKYISTDEEAPFALTVSELPYMMDLSAADYFFRSSMHTTGLSGIFNLDEATITSTTVGGKPAIQYLTKLGGEGWTKNEETVDNFDITYTIIPVRNYLVVILTGYTNETEQKFAQEMIGKITFGTMTDLSFMEKKYYTNEKTGLTVSLPSSSDLVLMSENTGNLSLDIYSKLLTDSLVSISAFEDSYEYKNLDNAAYSKKMDEALNPADTLVSQLFGISVSATTTDIAYRFNNQLTNVIRRDFETKYSDSGIVAYRGTQFILRSKDMTYRIEVLSHSASPERVSRTVDYYRDQLANSLSIANYQPIIGTPSTVEEEEEVNMPDKPAEENNGSLIPSDPVAKEKLFFNYANYSMIERLKGQILLQVEQNGEAWYLDPVTKKKYYLKNGPVAYEALRKFGNGITNNDLDKIPVGLQADNDNDTDGDGLGDKTEEALGTDISKADTDGDGYSDKTEILNSYNPKGPGKMPISATFTNQQKGKILLQVQNRGQAWYVNPKDGKRYYLKDGQAAYEIMKYLSTGITDDNLRQIPVGDI